MSSVDFKKLHSKQDIAAMLRHCDKNQRETHEHSNQDIRSDKSKDNLQSIEYDEALRRYEDRIRELDSTTNKNYRKDRVTCFGLEIPVPEKINPEQIESWYFMVTDLLKRTFKGKNVVAHYLHLDEIHDYYAHGEIKQSRAHIHAYVIPEIKGKLNGKAFSSRESMKKINNEIDRMTKEHYGCNFLTGEDPQRRTVEELKRISETEIQKKEKELQELERSIESYRRENRILKSRIQEYDERIFQLSEKLESLQDFDEMQRIYHKAFDDEIEKERQKKRSRGISR